MRVLNLQPVADRGGGAVKLVANFDLHLDETVRMFGLKLMQAPDGRRLVFAPNANGGRRLATFAPALAAVITKEATLELERHFTAHGTNSEA
jgi:hypothetical protein